MRLRNVHTSHPVLHNYSILDAIQAETSSLDCLSCNTELQTALQTLAADDTDDVCGTDVYAEECLVHHADALSAFEVCAGVTLDKSH